jgi:hypothetical protein
VACGGGGMSPLPLPWSPPQAIPRPHPHFLARVRRIGYQARLLGPCSRGEWWSGGTTRGGSRMQTKARVGMAAATMERWVRVYWIGISFLNPLCFWTYAMMFIVSCSWYETLDKCDDGYY